MREGEETYFSSVLKMGSTSDILPPIGSDILHLCSVFVSRMSPLARGSSPPRFVVDSSGAPLASPPSAASSFAFALSAFALLLFFLSEDSSRSALSLFLFSETLLACDLEDAIMPVSQVR